jgi:asparagine synthase (glutamine-hydrolysing)
VCGIAGQVRYDGKGVSEEMIGRMCAALEHRGPDSRGTHFEDGVGLGVQRLRVIDLVTGDQPIFNEDGSVAVVQNGEIYNYRELRSELERRGHRFATRSDTEVIVHLYEERGPACVESFHGMFALAIWDRRRRRLVLARDRPGKKPLFYSLGNRTISFASELHALLEDAGVPRELDHQALDAYLAYRYVPSPMSAFRAVRKLAPGRVLVFDAGGAQVERYWRLDYGRKRAVDDEEELVEELGERLRRAVRRRMIADVPLGAFLSGGIDSAAVTAAMAEASSDPVKTFSIGFHNDKLNELPLARRVARHFGTDHHEQIVEPKAIEIIPRIVHHYGEPFADATAIPTFYLAEMARRHVTVALNGDGGDEAFAGYPRYVANVAASRLSRVPRGLRQALGAAAVRLPPSGRIDSWRSRLRRVGATIALDAPERYLAYMSDLRGLRRDRLYTDDYRALVGESVAPGLLHAAWRESSATSVLDRMLDVDVEHYLPDDLLTKVDIATMAFSLEGRSPLLDHELLEFAAELPPRLKIRGGRKKVALRRALRGWVPDEVLDAPKRGFEPPLAEWLRGELRGYACEILLDQTTRRRGQFRTEYVRELLDRHAQGIEDHAQGIWTLLMLELWQREFVDRSPAGALAAGADPIA